MIRTVIIPKEDKFQLSIPANYVGKEVEVLLYTKDELEERPAKGNAKRFKGLLTDEEANKYNAYLKQARTEWERDI